MNRLKTGSALTVALGILSMIAILLCHLALTDIWHGVGDLSAEWRMLQVGFGVIILFHLAALAILIQFLWRFGRRDLAAGA